MTEKTKSEYLIGIIILVTATVISGISNSRKNNELLSLIKSQQPAEEVELSRAEEETFLSLQELTDSTIKKASEHDGDPNDFSFEDQKEFVLELKIGWDRNPILTEDYPILLEARWPTKKYQSPYIFLTLSPNHGISIQRYTLLRYLSGDGDFHGW